MSPDVYDDVKRIITSEAAALGLSVQWPNIDFTPPPPPSLWLSIDLAAEASEAMELGGATWLESGAIWLHLMLSLNTGVDLGLAYRKSLSNAFRGAIPMCPGLYYDRHSYDPLSEDSGVWRRLSLAVSYRFQDASYTAIARAVLGGRGGSSAAAL